MKNIIMATVLILSATSTASYSEPFDYSVLEGEWGAYQDNIIKDDWYNYLKLTSIGGRYVYSYGCKPIVFNFDTSQMTQMGGLLFIQLKPNSKNPMRLVVSAFRTAIGSALLTGSLYMFKSENGVETLFNTIPQRMTDLKDDKEMAEKLLSAIASEPDDC